MLREPETKNILWINQGVSHSFLYFSKESQMCLALNTFHMKKVGMESSFYIYKK